MLMAIGQEGIDRQNAVSLPLDPYDFSRGTTFVTDIVDIDNGPKPLYVSVEKIFGGRAMRVEFEIEVCRKLCNQDISYADIYPRTEPNIDAVSSPSLTSESEAEAERKVKPSKRILSNRWSSSETKDANWVTTRVFQGTLRVAHKGVFPHLMRYLVVPPLLSGYQRVSSTFANDPTDLVLKYRIEDRERHRAPPPPAIDWSGHYVESSASLGQIQIAELNVRLIGPPSVDKQELIGAAGRVINARMGGIRKSISSSADKDFSVKLLDSFVVEVLGEPIIEMRVRVQYATEDSKFFGLRLKEIGKPLNFETDSNSSATGTEPEPIAGYQPDQWPVPLPYDSESPSGILSCYLQNPCSVWHTPVNWPEGYAEPYESDGASSSSSVSQSDDDDDSTTDATYERRPEINQRSVNKLDHDVRIYSAEQNFPDEDKKDQIAVSEEQFGGDPYTFVKIESTYVVDTGVKQIPIANTDPNASKTCAIIQLHGGVAKRVFRMEASRVGKLPLVPEPTHEVSSPNGVREVLMSHKLRVDAPTFGTDLVSQEYRVLAEYVYAMERPPRENEKLRLAISPIDNTQAQTRTIDPSEIYTDTLIDWNVSLEE